MNASETGIVREAIWQLDHGQRLAARGILTRLLLSQQSSDVSAPGSVGADVHKARQEG